MNLIYRNGILTYKPFKRDIPYLRVIALVEAIAFIYLIFIK